MGISHLLEDFGAYTRGRPVSITDVSLEEQRLEAFEKGYQAGWDDSCNASVNDTRRVTADFAQNMQDLSFTYQEAYIAALTSLKPLLEQMTSTILPALMQKSFGAQLVEQLHELAREHGPQPVELITAPANAGILEAILDDTNQMPIKVVEQASMADGQIRLGFGSHEREIDLSGVLATIHQITENFFEETQKEMA